MNESSELNIFESKQSLSEFAQEMLRNPMMLQQILQGGVSHPEIVEFAEGFFKVRAVRDFFAQISHAPHMLVTMAEQLNAEHPIIAEVFEKRTPRC